MKKNFSIFFIFIFMFIIMPLNVKGSSDKVCLYKKEGDSAVRAALHVSNSKLLFDIYRSGNSGFLPNIFDNELEKRYGVIRDPFYGEYKFSDPCPQKICENIDFAGLIDYENVIIKNGSCLGNWTFNLYDEKSVTDFLNGLDELIAYQYNGSDAGKVSYSTIMDGGCPSSEPIFKLAKSAYGILRIAAPVVLVLFASLDLGKAVIASDEGQIKKAQSHLIKRIAAAVVVFLVFVIIELFVGMVSGGSDAMSCVNQFLN